MQKIDFDTIITFAEKLAIENNVNFRYYFSSNGHSLYIKYYTENAETCCRFSDHEPLTNMPAINIKTDTKYKTIRQVNSIVKKTLTKRILALRKKSLISVLEKLQK